MTGVQTCALPICPLGMTGVGARALGLTGDTLAAQMINSGLSGTAIGALDAAARGQSAKEGAETGALLGAAGPVAGRAIGSVVGGARNVFAPVTRAPANEMTVAGVRIPITQGEALGDVEGQRFVESARKGVMGESAKHEVNSYDAMRTAALDDAKNAISRSFGGGRLTPLEAAEATQSAVQSAAKQAKQAASDKYDEFGTMHGTVHYSAFKNIGDAVRTDISRMSDPVPISDVLTPAASQMIRHLDENLGRLRIQDRASPWGNPDPSQVVGISLKGLDQSRKELLKMRSAAANDTDRAASGQVISAFDKRLQDAVGSALYSGDQAAFGTLQEARRLYSEYSKTFRSQGSGDMSGRVVENMIGKYGQPATANDVSNWLYGATKIGGNREAPHVADKLKGIFGAQSAEWQNVRQGLFSKLVDTAEGKIPDGPQKVSQRIFEFLNGSGKQLSERMFTPQERALIDQFGQIMKRITPVPGAVNYSNSGYQMASQLRWTINGLASIAGLHVGGPIGALAGVGANAASRGAMDALNSRAVARQLYESQHQPAMTAARLRNIDKAAGIATKSAIGI